MSSITIGGYRGTAPAQGTDTVTTSTAPQTGAVGSHSVQTNSAATPNHVGTGIVPSAQSAQVPLAQRNAAPASAPAAPLSADAAKAALAQLVGKAIDPRVASDFIGKIGLDHLGRVTAEQSDTISITQSDIDRLQGATIKSLTQTNSAGERAMRSEREVVMDFVNTLSKARDGAGSMDQQVIDGISDRMQSLWLGSNLNTTSAAAALRAAGSELAGVLPDLSAAAMTFAKEVEQGVGANGAKPIALYHDNALGRRFESELVQSLVKAPPAPVTDAAGKVGTFLRDAVLDSCRRDPTKPIAGDPTFGGHSINAGELKSRLNTLCSYIKSDPRPWHAETPEIKDFLDTMGNAQATDQDKVDAFATMMGTTQNGFDVMKQSYLGVKTSLMLNNFGGGVPWMKAANENYSEVVVPARTITPAVGGKAHMVDEFGRALRDAHTVETRSFGTPLPHQPAMQPDDVDTTRWMSGKSYPASMHTDVTSGSIKAFELGALYNNQNNVNGASGSTNIMTHLYIEMAAQGIDVNFGDAFAGTMMFLTYDGGHSLPESTGTFRSIMSATQLASRLPNAQQLEIRRDVLANHVLSYDDLDSYFDSAETKAAMKVAVDTAFGRTQTFFDGIRSERATARS